jgi:hypothetical protein
MQYTYHIEGMHCAKCVDKIKAIFSPHFTHVEVTLNPPRLQLEAATLPNLEEINTRLTAVGDYKAQPTSDTSSFQKPPSYYPLFLITLYILGVALINNIQAFNINWHGLMNHFMAGFFLVFSAFKLLDLRGFADGYATYDLLAKRWYTYGFIYPFLELSLGILYVGNWLPTLTPILTIIIMGSSSLGVTYSLLKNQNLQCACVGTLLNVPLSTITLIEDLLMVVLAAVELFFS